MKVTRKNPAQIPPVTLSFIVSQVSWVENLLQLGSHPVYWNVSRGVAYNREFTEISSTSEMETTSGSRERVQRAEESDRVVSTYFGILVEGKSSKFFKGQTNAILYCRYYREVERWDFGKSAARFYWHVLFTIIFLFYFTLFYLCLVSL